MLDAMLRGWRAQQKSRGMRDETAADRERLVRRFCEFTNEYPWRWTAGHVDEWSAYLTGERHLAPSTIRLTRAMCGCSPSSSSTHAMAGGPACEEAFGTYPVAICHEWNTLAHLNDYEGSPEARPFTREELQRYAENVRPRFGYADHPALWVTERGSRVRPSEINARFVAYRDALGLPAALTVHSERHAYVTHLTEDGVDRRFIQQQVGHECDSSTAVYTHVSDDFMNTALSRALAPAFAGV